MRRRPAVFGAVIAGVLVLAGAGFAYHQGLIFDRSEQHWAVVQSYCTECHNAAEATGDLVLEGLSPEAIPEKAEVFEAAVRKLRGRQMPPPGNPQPEQRALDGLVSFIEASIDEHAPEPRQATFRSTSESDRVRARRARIFWRRDRRREVLAERNRGRRLHEHRRPLSRVARPSSSNTSASRARSHGSRSAKRNRSSRARISRRRAEIKTDTSTACRSALAAAPRSSIVFRRTANTASR